MKLRRQDCIIQGVRILGMNCSQRKQSNSESLLDYVLNALKTTGAGHKITKINLREIKIDCMGCEQCLADISYHNDGLSQLYKNLLETDLIILSTPTCYGMPPAFGKVFMDRADPFWEEKLLKGKKGAVIVNGASPNERIEECKQAVHWFFDAHGIQPLRSSPCFNNSGKYPELRYPNPLPQDFQRTLDKLVHEIESVAT